MFERLTESTRRRAAAPCPPRATLQAKLRVAATDDPLEREADRVAEAVVDGRSAVPRGVAGELGALRKSSGRGEPTGVADTAVARAVSAGGAPLPAETRDDLGSRLGRDFSSVRVHADAPAADSARALGARAYTWGDHVVFGAGEYAPGTREGRRLLAHELAHVAQQDAGAPQGVIRRAPCLSGATCASPPGSAERFVSEVESREKKARDRRGRMSPDRQRATGHVGPARQLEKLLEAQAPGLFANIHGIFIDQDMDPQVIASVQSCDSMVPPITGATKPCVFVHGNLNQEALKFNTDPSATTIGGVPREDWRINAVQTLIHEVQHVLYFNAVSPRARPAGVTSCTRAAVDTELSELAAVISEFPTVFDAVPAGASSTHPAKVRLRDWFDHSITNPGESIRGALTVLRCKCSCPDADKFVAETFAFVSSSWSTAQKDAFHAELRRAAWGLSWPL
jgi:hypothetical protein